MAPSDRKKLFSKTAFIALSVCVVIIALLYLFNIVRWAEYPDFGFAFRTATGMDVVGIVSEQGRKAGMRVGDRIIRVNDKDYTDFQAFRSAMHRELGEKNVYLIRRNGRQLEITIRNVPMGFKASFIKSGFLYLLGLSYAFIGVLVFLMKPHQRSSWLFFLFTCVFGFFLVFLYKLSNLTPIQLETFHTFVYTFTPAVIIHLASSFPEEKRFFKKHAYAQSFPYIASAVLFVAIRSFAPTITDAPKTLFLAVMLYMAVSVLFFLGSCIHLWLASRSVMVKLRAKMIVLGIGISASVPLIDFITSTLFRAYILPGFNYYLPFFIVFPLFVAYAIIKHDLFDIDAVIKRTYGYVLTTGAVAGIYGLFVLLSNLAFGGFGFARSPYFPLIFILAVVFLLNPIRNRLQRLIDRLFYRLEYDYRETVQRISETMRTLLSLDEIVKSLVDIPLKVMFIDSGCVMLLNRDKTAFECHPAVFTEGSIPVQTGTDDVDLQKAATRGGRPLPMDDAVEPEPPDAHVLDHRADARQSLPLSNFKLPVDEPLVHKIEERKKEVTIYDTREDPLFEQNRGACEMVFDQLRAALIVPLIYEDRLIGLISLGNKKSGKFYRREDINLLKTLANQGAVAVENALLLEEMIEKERMEEELSIARDLQMSVLPTACPQIKGFDIAALSAPAREVGGDFFDFIEMGEDRLGLVVGDVTGKSVSGALVMSASRTLFRMLSEEELTVGEIMNRANRGIKRDIRGGMYVALLYAVFHIKERTVSLCSAGQTRPILFASKDEKVTLVETEGDSFPLGVLEESDYRETRLRLMPGDRIVFYTDGIVEAMNGKGEMFGFDRFMGVIQGSRATSAAILLKEITAGVEAFVSGIEQHDDLTAIVVTVNS